MSFPPRPPMGMPPMGPGGMMPRYPGYTPMGMMPMGMGMMPMMPQPAGMPPTTSAGQMNRNSKKLVPQEIPKKSQTEDKPPVTTVFVGNISERAPDAMIRQMLQRCGNVLSWKRVQGASGKLQAFGFCEYEDPEATLRCIRLLNEWRIADKTLVVKVDAKTKALLDEYKKKKRNKAVDDKKKEIKPDEDGKDSDKEQGEIVDEDKPSDDDADELDEFCQREDRVATAGLDAIMKEYAQDLAKVPLPEMTVEQKRDKRREKKDKEKIDKEPGLDDMELGEEELSLINREIKSFRDAHKEDEVQQREREREREREARRRREEEWERERERERERELRRERERERERREREYSRRTRSRSRERTRERTRERSMSRDLDPEDEEEAYERRKLERKIREKEAAYQELLMKWEARERKKSREYEKEREREEERRLEEAREARRLKEFLEDYDDERDDPKYYKGSALQRRLKEREKEMEADERDRQREKEELEEIRKKLEEEGHPDIEAEMARIEKERDEHLMPRLQLSDDSDDSDVVEMSDPAKENVMQQMDYKPVARPEPAKHENLKIREESCEFEQKVHSTLKPIDSNSMTSISSAEVDQGGTIPANVLSEETTQDSTSWSQSGAATQEDKVNNRLGFGGLKIGAMESPDPQQQRRKKLTVGEVFNQDEEEDKLSKRHRLVPLDYSEEERTALIMPSKPTTAEEKRKCIKNLIERIPTGKEELFAYRLDWKQVDQVLMDKRIKPWVNKKIVEYIGEEEPTLTEFICSKVMAHSAPHNILNDVAMVLDEEAEVFVVKMWRLLIYETEAKKLGLVK